MRKISVAAILTIALFTSCKKDEVQTIPNNQALKWAQEYGGADYDFASAVIQLPDGSYVYAGNSRSAGTITPTGSSGYDVWLSKTDNNGIKKWSNTYGTSDDEYATGIVRTTDDGFLVTGYRFLNFKNTAFAIKTDSSGTQQWQKNLVQSDDAQATGVVSIGDGSYLVIGYTTTGNGKDGWITKIDNSGNIAWSKTYGGAGDDTFFAIAKSSDGNYILAGSSKSSSGDLTGNKGGVDGWVFKIDGSGNKIWSKSFGGQKDDYFRSIAVADDGSFLVAGYAYSGDGDVGPTKGESDGWFVKLDASGNKQWVKTYGGQNLEYITNVVKTKEGGFLTVGYTNSTDNDVPRKNGDFGGWLIKMDGAGNKVATSTYGGDGDDRTRDLIQTLDGGYLMVGDTFVPGKGYDAWIVKIDQL
jgi:hypothetical protein